MSTTELWHGSLAEIIESLTNYELVSRYLLVTEEELAQVVEPSLMKHLQQMQRLAHSLSMSSFAEVAEQQPQAMDCLLTELLMVATWHGWQLPITNAGTCTLPNDLPPAGLMNTNANADGATVWYRDGAFYLQRARVAGFEADMRPHWGSS